MLAGHAHRKVAFAAIAVDRYLALALHAGARRLDQLGQLRHDFAERMAQRFGAGMSDQPFGRTVEDADQPFRVDADDAGAGARQHGLGEAAAAVDDVARAHDIVALGAQLLRHLVEGLAQLREVALRAPDRHLHMQISGRHHLRRSDQAPDRRDQIVRKVETDPHRGKQHDQRDDSIHQAEGDLHAQRGATESRRID